MFVRKKKNSIVVVNKSDGTYREIKSFGASSDIGEIKILEKQASDWISQYSGQQEIYFDETAQVVAERFVRLSHVLSVAFRMRPKPF